MVDNQASHPGTPINQNGARPPSHETAATAPVASAATEGRFAQIIGWGYHVPEKVITNRDLEQIVDTNDEWIRSRTGMVERRISHVPVSELGYVAAARALEAGISKVVFDRSGARYHGKVKAIAEAARSAGLSL